MAKKGKGNRVQVIQDGESIPIPSAIEMVAELFRNSGEKYGRYLVPVWNRTSRTLYKGKGDSLKLASKYTDNGDWDEAFSIWKDLSQSTDSTSVSKAYYNMAVYYELEDNLGIRTINKNGLKVTLESAVKKGFLKSY